MEAFGGVGVHATTPAELRKAMEEAIRSRKPTLINAVIDEARGHRRAAASRASIRPQRRNDAIGNRTHESAERGR
mgnify:CR=1 FL=1